MAVKSDNLKHRYTTRYFLEECEGNKDFINSKYLSFSPRLEHIFSLGDVKSNDKVLDVGFGRGEILLKSAQVDALAYGIDYSESAHLLLMQKLETAGLMHLKNKIIPQLSSCTKLPYQDEFFDKVFFIDTLEHLSESELMLTLKEINRVLKSNGVLIINTPNRYCNSIGSNLIRIYKSFTMKSFTMLRWQVKPVSKEESHINVKDYFSLRRSLILNGFESRIIFTCHREDFVQNCLSGRIKYFVLYTLLKPFFSWDLTAICRIIKKIK